MITSGAVGLLSLTCTFTIFSHSFIPTSAFSNFHTHLNAQQHQRQKRQVYLTDLPPSTHQNFSVITQQGQRVPDYGPWGPWTESSGCSRTCGGGIAYQDRICLSVRADGRHSCGGASRRYFSCNVEDCPQPQKDFRAEQCSRFNSVPYKGKFYSWLPYYGGISGQNPCELNCVPQGSTFYAKLDRRVIDGTRCRQDGSLDVCVDGQCLAVGCDKVLGSTKIEDECRVCGGDGSSCKVVKGTLEEDNFELGYNDILFIPIGSTSIVIQEVHPTNNFLALRNAAGDFYLNGNFRIEFSREIVVAGTLFRYERDRYSQPETLRALGPTLEPIFVVLLLQGKNQGISYEYSVPSTTRTHQPGSYEWKLGEFEECSQTCGGGVQYRPVRCIGKTDDDFDVVGEELCDPVQKPAVNVSCNNQPCPSGWQIGEWSECSESCGGGTQFRLVFCHQSTEGGAVMIPDELCEEEKPIFMRACNVDQECPEWKTGEWSECDRSCGTGAQTRSVECKSNEEVLDDDQCVEDKKPSNEQNCTLGPCEGVEWVISSWSGCEGSCNPQMESREVLCSNEVGEVFPDDACEAGKKPALTRPCPTSTMCDPMWHTSEWTECSVKCGKGVQSRVVFCGAWENDSVIKIEDDKCNPEKKFEDTQNCSAESCDGVWYTGPWNRCSVPCGGGERTRKILCFHEVELVSTDQCDSENEPYDKESCNMTPCDEDEIMTLGGCKDSKFGCCLDGVTPAGQNDEGCPRMDITSTNNTCDEAEYGCCSDNFTLAMGPFKRGCASLDSCNLTTFGCCPDQTAPASGPDFEGCDIVNCTETVFGCCEDNVTAAAGPELEGCGEPIMCSNSTFGCCPDNTTVATGPDEEGCSMDETPCANTTFGCCFDGLSAASGPDYEGCYNVTTAFPVDIESSGEDCYSQEFGCCPDGLTPASGPDQDGCEGNATDCKSSAFGCCADGVAYAQGPSKVGCFDDESSGDGELPCEDTIFGCCPDNVTIAKGFDEEGCYPEHCSNSTFGCCPDNTTSATGPDNQGCFPEDCSNSTFGCCPDNMTTAIGPDDEGCFPENCANSTFGCCPDNTTSATGPDNEGCHEPLVDCINATFGCCPDNTTLASGSDFEGCENATDCNESEFGCCQDNVTLAAGPGFEGCSSETVTMGTTTVPPACVGTQFGCCPDEETTALGRNLEGCCFGMRFGCCPDNKTAALGPTFLGCGCQTYPYGCCPDEITPAQGFNYFGCRCENFRYGCCQDNATPATGPNFEGCVCHLMQFGCCPDGRTPKTNEAGDGCGCDSARFGCCPDGRTPATSADLSGCPCDTLPYGCCPDGYTPARTSDLRECPCTAQRYGCCLDGRTAARGPNYEGCVCDSTRFGCCQDGRTTAQGPDFYGCPCGATRFGCCADGYTTARGPKYEGCPDVQQPKPKVSTEVCSEPKESGPCRNFTVMWYFDVLYGSCSRFWYGGCDGTRNKFSTSEECETTCVKPDGPESCLLPKTAGSCNEKIPSWYYDVGSESCEAFTYGGCLGNNNRFVTKEACEQKCISLQPHTPVDVCSLAKDEGPCDTPTILWFFNRQASRCEQFNYGGCGGNANRFESRRECEKSCISTVPREKDICRLPQEIGTCTEFRERWFFDYEIGLCHRFMYSGCDGNDNNFGTFTECAKRCGRETTSEGPKEFDFRTEYCFLSQDPGPCNLADVNWYYDSSDGVCKEFRYGGCKGNQNRFKTRKECETSCFQSQDVCSLGVVKGPCSGAFTQWYYDKEQGDCLEFTFTGCQGNANRFNNKESCYQRCRREKLTTLAPSVQDDVCSKPQEPGPCLGYYRMWFYDGSDNKCKSFVYGGCEGNGNRFDLRADCEARCIKKRTLKVPSPSPVDPQPSRTSNEDVCRLPVEPGPCTEAHPRWFYDAQTQSCLPFVFGGCGGNKNRFKTSEICLRFCTGIKATSTQQQAIPVTTSTTVAPAECPPSNCAEIQCPYGIEETFDLKECSTCRCSNPCEAHSCPDGSRCAIDVVRTSREGIRTEPVCRRIKKSGSCPVVSRYGASSNADCDTRCRDDADCRGDHKCCNNGCAFNCVPPQGDYLIPATQPEPARILPGINMTEGHVGEPAELPCSAIGWPKPNVTWWRETTMLPLFSHRYEQLPDYALLIRSVEYEDRGDYSCHAHNGIGSGAIYKVTLVIDLRGLDIPPSAAEDGEFGTRDSEPLPSFDGLLPAPELPVPLETRISLVTNEPKSGSSLQLDCSVAGPPSGLVVSWTHNGAAIKDEERRRVLANNTLFIVKADASDSGEYKCSASLDGNFAISSLYINVKDTTQEPECVDNPHFSNCEVIVTNKYCNNKFYGKFCCASCMRAGLLPSPETHEVVAKPQRTVQEDRENIY